MRVKLLFIVFLFIQSFGFSQRLTLSQNAEISVLTIGPGKLLNDTFGHNAFRIKDKSYGIDTVYNYGVYDFNTPNFYIKFARGKLNYLIGKDSFRDFYANYTYQDRTIEEQVLNLTYKEKQALFDFLQTNYEPENRRYLYDFFYDNCATKIRDVVKSSTDREVMFRIAESSELKTFRELIYEHVDKNSWGSLGIDIGLGSVVDKQATAYEYMYLPKYIFEFFQNATIGSNDPLVKRTNILYKKRRSFASSSFLLSPLMILGLIGLLIIWITYKDSQKKRLSRWLDISIFTVTGLAGIIILLLWFATDHSATAQNFNLLWAFPLNLLVIVQLFKQQQKQWFVKYLKFLIIMLCLLALHWLVGIQVYAIGLIPILIALFIRYWYLANYLKTSAA